MRDKDGISAALLAAEVAAVLRERGETYRSALDAIARRWGVFTSAQVSLTRKGRAASRRSRAMMDAPTGVARRSTWRDDEVVAVADYDGAALRTGPAAGPRGAGAGPLSLPGATS